MGAWILSVFFVLALVRVLNTTDAIPYKFGFVETLFFAVVFGWFGLLIVAVISTLAFVHNLPQTSEFDKWYKNEN